jgi:hypothetical protein
MGGRYDQVAQRVFAPIRSGFVAAALILVVSACASARTTTPRSTKASSGSVPATSPTTLLTSLPTTAMPPVTMAPTSSAADLVSQATKNALVLGWAHMAMKFSGAGVTGAISADVGPTIGREFLEIGQSHGTTLIVAGTAYIRGDAAAMSNFFGFLPPPASRLADHWISLTAADPNFATVTEGITLASALSQITVQPPLTLGAPTQIDGQQVIGISGHPPASPDNGTGTGTETFTLYVTTGNRPIPVEITSTMTDGAQTGTHTLTFSAWGIPVALVAPGGAVPAMSIPKT